MSDARANMMALVARVSAGIQKTDWPGEVRAALDDYAHELAEEIRAYPRKNRTGAVGDMAREIQADFHAALIDPEVNT